jgi:histidinol-phosphate/aromatic aminotransferase/cobyric acid decarboxylase-like protein
LFDNHGMGRLTRRAFGWSLAAGPLLTEHALAQLSMLGHDVPPDAVLINANENPLGPCPEALEAMQKVLRDGGRYLYSEGFLLAEKLAETEGVPSGYVRVFAGSSDPLFRTVYACTSPSRPFVTADPGYEAGRNAASAAGAETIAVSLTSSHAHDVRAMVKAAPAAGVFYICNPNNPTGTLTPRDDIEWLVANKPEGSLVLIDEAYIHLSTSAVPCIDLVRAGKDVVVLRTFSKIYGMAGIRAGAAFARPDLLGKLSRYGTGMLPVQGMVGARVSLGVKNLVTERRRIIADIRNSVFAFFDKQGLSYVPSESNKFMLDVGRPGHEVAQALAREKIFVGRSWPSWPNHIRVSVGTGEEMAKFMAALIKVL